MPVYRLALRTLTCALEQHIRQIELRTNPDRAEANDNVVQICQVRARTTLAGHSLMGAHLTGLRSVFASADRVWFYLPVVMQNLGVRAARQRAAA